MQKQQSSSSTSKSSSSKSAPSSTSSLPSKPTSTEKPDPVDSNSSTPLKEFQPSAPVTMAKAEDLTSLFDKQREKLESGTAGKGGAFGMGGTLGFGFRGTIPKLPSFKVRISCRHYDYLN